MTGPRTIPNRRRGEIAAVLNGEPRLLCLTLGALAELESAFGVDNIAALGARLSGGGLSARDLIAVIGAGLRGAGNIAGDEDVGQMTAEDGLAGMARIAAELLAAAFGDAAMPPPAGAPAANPCRPQAE